MDKYLKGINDVDNYQFGPHINVTLVTNLWAEGAKLPKYPCSYNFKIYIEINSKKIGKISLPSPHGLHEILEQKLTKIFSIFNKN